MQLTYEVHSVQETDVLVNVQYLGQTIPAHVSGVEVELLGPSYSHIFRFTDPTDVAEALTWAVGDTIQFNGA